MLKKNWLQTKSHKTQNDHLWTKYFITYGTFKHIFWHFFSDDLDMNYHFFKVYDWHDITIKNWDRSFFSLGILLLVRFGREHEICNNFFECLRKLDQYCPWSNNQNKVKLCKCCWSHTYVGNDSLYIFANPPCYSLHTVWLKRL